MHIGSCSRVREVRTLMNSYPSGPAGRERQASWKLVDAGGSWWKLVGSWWECVCSSDEVFRDVSLRGVLWCTGGFYIRHACSAFQPSLGGARPSRIASLRSPPAPLAPAIAAPHPHSSLALSFERITPPASVLTITPSSRAELTEKPATSAPSLSPTKPSTRATDFSRYCSSETATERIW